VSGSRTPAEGQVSNWPAFAKYGTTPSPVGDGSGSKCPELFSQLVFRAVVGDEDGHGKNYGLLLEGGKVAVAPLYDCLSTQIYPSLAGRMGTQLGRQVNLAAVDLTALVEEGVACGIGESEATQLVDTLTDRILAAMQAISPPSVDVRALECVLGTIGLRVGRLREGKPMGVPPENG